MRKLLLGIIPVIMLIFGCTGSARPIESVSDNSGLLTLDQALKEAATRIDERIQSGSKIVPLNFNSPHDRFSNYVLEELTANLVDSRILTIVDRREIDSIRSEFSFEFSGDVEENSMQQIGRRLGAQSVISGNFTDMGGFIRIMIRVLNVENATVDVQYRANIASDTVTTALLTGGRTNVTSSGGGSSVAQVPQANVIPAQPQTSVPTLRYTVTFNANRAFGIAPSPQTVQNGETIALPDVGELINARHSFRGWNTRADGTGTSYSAGDSFTVNTNITLFAHWIEIVYSIGDRGPAGGWIFFDMGFYMDGWRYLEAASQDFPNKVQFGGCGVITDTSVGSGMQNTARVASDLNGRGESLRAAQIVSVPQYGSFNDWFLPSRDELNLMFQNLKQRRIGSFSNDNYWSSSCNNTYMYAWAINFSDGQHNQYAGVRSDGLVRAVRRF